MYPRSYHDALNHLIHTGISRDKAHGRKLIARALRALRKGMGNARARRERRHMLFITGMFPTK